MDDANLWQMRDWSRQLHALQRMIENLGREINGLPSDSDAPLGSFEMVPLEPESLLITISGPAVPWHPDLPESPWPTVRIVHRPTGVLEERRARSQLRAQAEALNALTLRVRRGTSRNDNI